MALNIKQFASGVSAENRRLDIPVFVGPTKFRRRESITFIDENCDSFVLNVKEDDIIENVSISITHWKRASDDFDIEVTEENENEFVMDVLTMKKNAGDSLVLVSMSDNSVVFASTLTDSTIYYHWIKRFVLETAIPIGKHRCCFVDLTTEVIPFVVNGDEVKILYDKAKQIKDLKPNERACFVEYDICRRSTKPIESPGADGYYQEQHMSMSLGIMYSEDCIIIPSYDKSDVENVIRMLGELKRGYYIVPINQPKEVVQAIAAFVNKSERMVAILPPQDLNIMSDVRFAYNGNPRIFHSSMPEFGPGWGEHPTLAEIES